MNRYLAPLILVLLTTALAGCHAPANETAGDGHADGRGDGADGADGTDGGDALELTLTVMDPPAQATVGTPFDVVVKVEGDHDATSSHLGAHYGNTSTEGTDPVTYTQTWTKTSPHVTTATALPGEYTIMSWNFTAEDVGMVYYRAHVATAEGSFWGEELTIEVMAAS